MRMAADHANFVACMADGLPIGRPAHTMYDFHDFGLTWKCHKICPCGCTITSKTKINVVWTAKMRPKLWKSRIVCTSYNQMHALLLLGKDLLDRYYFSVIEERKVPGVEWAKALFYWHQQFHFAKYQHMYYFRDTGYYAWAMKIAPITMKQWF